MINNNKNLTVINLWGGASSGKSTVASGLYHLMKLRKHRVELISEFAKQMVWEKQHSSVFENQLLILAKQEQRQKVLVDQVSTCITDSPILMGLAYKPELYYESFDALTKEVFDSYNNINIFLNRFSGYDPVGRNQTYEEALEKDMEIKTILDSYDLEYYIIDADYLAHIKIYEKLFGELE